MVDRLELCATRHLEGCDRDRLLSREGSSVRRNCRRDDRERLPGRASIVGVLDPLRLDVDIPGEGRPVVVACEGYLVGPILRQAARQELAPGLAAIIGPLVLPPTHPDGADTARAH